MIPPSSPPAGVSKDAWLDVLRMFVERCGLAFTIWRLFDDGDPDTLVLEYASANASGIAGLDYSKLVGAPLRTLTSSARFDIYLEVARGHGPKPLGDFFRAGTWFSAIAITLPGNRVAAVFENISKYKEYEGQARFLDSILDNLPAMVFVKDANELRFVRFNKAGEELVGQSRHELIGKNDFDLFPASQAEAFTAKDREVLVGKAVLDIPEEPILTATGLRYLHTKKIPILDAQERPLFLLGISEDITEEKESVEKLRRATLELARSNAELGHFAYVASHDLQEPLRKVLAFGDRLKAVAGAALGPEGLDYLERMTGAAQRMRRLIDDLLALSRVATSSEPFAEVDLSEVLREVLSDLEMRNEASKATVVVDDLPTLSAVPVQMRQLFQNLLANAMKFRRPDAAPRIEVRAKPIAGSPAQVEILVIDDGIGFEEKHADRIFGAFQRLHSRTAYEGTGIGLAICRRIAERHGGTIKAYSRAGEGATFVVTLPIAQPESEP